MGLFDSISSALGFAKNIPIVGDIIGGAGKFLGSAAGDFLGNALGISNADRAYEQSKEATALAFDRSMEAYKSRYQNTTADMRAAGLNPILAATGGFSVGSAPQMASAQAFQAPAPYGYAAQSVRNITETEKVEEEVKKVIQETDRTMQEVQKVSAEKELAIQKRLESIAQTQKARAEAGKANAQEWESTTAAFEAQARMVKMRSEIEKNYADAHQLMTRANLNEQERKNLAEKIQNISVERTKLEQEINVLLLQMDKMARIADVYASDAGATIAYAKEIADVLDKLPSPFKKLPLKGK